MDAEFCRLLQGLILLKAWGSLLCWRWQMILYAIFLAISLTNAASEDKHAHHRQRCHENTKFGGFVGKSVVAEVRRLSAAQSSAKDVKKVKGEKTRLRQELRRVAF